MTGFVKAGWHPLAGTRVGPKAAARPRQAAAGRSYRPLQPAAAPPAAPEPPAAAQPAPEPSEAPRKARKGRGR